MILLQNSEIQVLKTAYDFVSIGRHWTAERQAPLGGGGGGQRGRLREGSLEGKVHRGKPREKCLQGEALKVRLGWEAQKGKPREGCPEREAQRGRPRVGFAMGLQLLWAV